MSSISKKKVAAYILGTILMLTIMMAVKPVRKLVLTYSIKVLARLDNRKIDDTPNIELKKLSIQAIDKEDSDEDKYTFVKKNAKEIYQGNLILVNNSNVYRFMEQDKLLNLKKCKNQYYKIAEEDMYLSKQAVEALNNMMQDFEKATEKHDMIITSSYRGLKEQEEALDEKISQFGEKDALKWAMLPGYSEHHTGYAVDMSIMTDDDIHITYRGQGQYAWINQNCFKYGFIRRYAEDKVSITGVSNEPWHYRYVGSPHAYLMTIKNMCLEEYISYIRQFTFNQEHLYIFNEQGKYEIYYVQADKEIQTLIPVPKNKPYNISGNNIDGFIVAVKIE